MSNPEPIVIVDFSDNDESSRESTPVDGLTTPPLNPSDHEPSDHELKDSRDRSRSLDLDVTLPFWSPSSSPMGFDFNESEMRESTKTLLGHKSFVSHGEVDDSQFNTVRSAINALEAISNKPDAACSRDVIDIADQNLLHIETIHGLSSDTISQTGLGTFLERQMGCTFPEDTLRSFRQRLRSLFLQCNEIVGMDQKTKEADDHMKSGRTTVSSSVEPVDSEPMAATATPAPMRSEVPQVDSDILPNDIARPSNQPTEILGSSSTEARTRWSTCPDSSQQLDDRSSSPSSSQPATETSTPSSTTPESEQAVKPDLELLDPTSQTNNPSQQRLPGSPTPRTETSDIVTSIEAKIKELEEQITATTETVQRADAKIVKVSLAASNLEEQIKTKKESRKLLWWEQRCLKDQIKAVTEEINEHGVKLQKKNETALQHREDKISAQNLLNKLAESKRKQEKKLDLVLEDKRLQQEIPDPTIRALARRLRAKPEDDELELESDSGASALSKSVGSSDSDSVGDSDDEDNSTSSLSSSSEDDDEAEAKPDSSGTVSDNDDLLHNLLDAYTRVADKDSNEVTISDFAEMGQAFDRFTGTSDIKDDTDDKAGIESEIKREAAIKTQEATEDAEPKFAADINNSTEAMSSTQPDISDMNLSNLTAEDLRASIAAVQYHSARLKKTYSLLGAGAVSQTPEPGRLSSTPVSRSGQKRKKPETGGDTKRNIFDLIETSRSHRISQPIRPFSSFFNSRQEALVWSKNDDSDASGETRPAKRSKILPTTSEGSSPPLRRVSLAKLQRENGWKKPEPFLTRERGRSSSKDDDAAGNVNIDEDEIYRGLFRSSGVKKHFNRNFSP